MCPYYDKYFPEGWSQTKKITQTLKKREYDGSNISTSLSKNMSYLSCPKMSCKVHVRTK